MSGDAQPRKRKDKRRRKEEEELYPNLKETDEVIHVYKDAHTGGNIVTKVIFFCLMGGIAVMIGLILLEHRGTTDDDHPAKETPWSLQFDDWSKLAAIPDLVPDFLKGTQGDHDHHASHSGEVVDDHGGEEEQGHDDHGHEEPAQDSGGWFSFSIGGWGGNTDEGEPAEQEEAIEPEVTSSWFSLNYFGGGDEKVEELVEEIDENEEPPASEEVEGSQLSEEQEPEEEEEEEGEESASLEEQEEFEENDSREELDEDDNLSREPFDDEDEPQSPEQFEEEEEDEPAQSEENEELESGEGEEEDDDPRGSVFPRRSSIIEEDETESAEQEEETENEEEKLRNTSEEELFPEAIEALQREASELLREQKEAERRLKNDENAVDSEEEQSEKQEEEEESPGEQEEQETEGMALKFGVGVALVVVAHVVLVKKWNSWAAEGNEGQANVPATQAAHPSSTPSRTPPPSPELSLPDPKPLLPDWAEEAFKSAELPVVSSAPRSPTPEEEYEEETDPEEEEEEDEEEDLSEEVPPINPKIYEELLAKYGKPTPESSDAEASDDGNREYSDGGEVESVGEEESGGELEESEPEEEEDQNWTNLKKPVQVETESEDEEEEESDDEPPPPRKQPQGGSRSAYEPSAMDEEELLIRQQLEQANEEFNYERYEAALDIYRKVLVTKPLNVQALYGVAQILDKRAEEKKSNALLQEAIDAYLQLLGLDNIPDSVFLPVAQRAINRLRFKGLHMKAVGVHKQIINRFNDTVEYHNDLAINYLMVNRLSDAEQVFLDTLRKWPDDPVALSHYGLVLKLNGQTAESIPHLQRGLAPDHPTTRDARLYFHLGDALSRDGRPGEAMEVYRSGVKKGLFRSEYQRSLYNVDHLTARPWWTQKQTTYEGFFKMLEGNWKVIRDEGLSAMKLKGLYQDEAENLRDVGDWKQFQLFTRGSKYAENCKKTPVTCTIIGNFAPAKGCKRGQSKFSVMEGGTHVWPHCGPTNCRLRAHLGLVVPPGPAIRVGNETRKWVEGKVMVFDDSFEHEVWHNGTALRLVLIVDVWHPDLSPAEKAALSPI